MPPSLVGDAPERRDPRGPRAGHRRRRGGAAARYPQRKEAQVLIARAYQQLRAYVPPGSPEQRAFRELAAQAYRTALDLDPSDVDVRLHHAAMLTDLAERTREHEEAVRLAPTTPWARWALAADLLRAGNQAEGSRQLAAAAERLTPADVATQGWQIAAELRWVGLEREAAKLDERVKASGHGSR